MGARKSFYDLFLESTELHIDKWHHYFEFYEKYFEKFRGQELSFLEIGVQMGGSAKLFRKWLGDGCKVTGIDIDPQCKQHEIPGQIEIEVGDQSDPDFLQAVAEKHGPFDIIPDGGGHRLFQIWTSFDTLFDHLKVDGIYFIEDVAPQYFSNPFYRAHPESKTVAEFIDHLFRMMCEDSAKNGLFDHWMIPLHERQVDMMAKGADAWSSQ